MSSYNKMIESISPYDPRKSLNREVANPPYPYARREIEPSEGALWRQCFRIFRKHWRGSLAFILLVELILGLLVVTMDNTYEARSVIDVEPLGADSMGLDRESAAISSNVPAYLDTQTEILNSDGLAMSVINQLHLDQNQAFLKPSVLQRAMAWIESWLPSNNKEGIPRDTERLLTLFHKNMTIGEVKGSQLVEIRFESTNPQLAADVANATVEQFIDRTYRSRYEATLRAAQSLSPHLADLQNSVKQSTDALLEFQKKHPSAELGAAGPVSTDGTTGFASASGSNPIATRVSELNQQLTQAMGERLQQESYMKQIKEGNVDSLPQMKDSPLIQGLTSRLVDSRAQLAQALGVYGSNNPQIRKLEMESDELTKQLDTERARIASQIQSAYNSAQNREQLIQNTLNGMKGQLDQSNAEIVQYDALKREADANGNLYTTLSSRTKELALTGALNSGNIRVVDQARTPLSPDGPHRLRILAFGALFGIFGGAILAFAAEQMNDTISSVEDFRQWSGMPTLALVPQISIPGSKPALGSGKPTRMAMRKSMAAIRLNGMKFLTENPNSPEAEAIRNLETSIRIPCSSVSRGVQTILVTSALPGEGKTTVATNLALALSRHGKTCLIDGDFRHPSITSSFGLTARIGLQDLLTNPTDSLDESIKPVPEVPNLTVLGVGARIPNSLECLTSARMTDLVSELRTRFEYIVLDSPPVIPFSEGRWLSTLSDASILVVRCDCTARSAVTFSLDILEDLKANVLGVVLNGVDLKQEYYSYGMKNYDSYVSK
ncbi:MAG TPA: polysaccharide biosynthesis tyrosine autokinase [Candidatus Saccharimonadales bacterium]|jgi:succinoglycan biosynthesis transport protein ExoP|nr:polysaccharide biosynthesis tyrosine autokinase [Candidatus Saccharimonadales bacterium]